MLKILCVTSRSCSMLLDPECLYEAREKHVLYLDGERIGFLNGDASIIIELGEIKADWFNTTSAIWAYVFSTDPAAENGTLVKVEAQISGTEMIPAEAFSGVVFKSANGDVAVTANGIY